MNNNIDLDKLESLAARIKARGLFNAACELEEMITQARASMPVQAAPSELHNAIMGIPCQYTSDVAWDSNDIDKPKRCYQEGHRDALHAAAELVNEFGAPKAEDARDGARYRFLREHWVSFSAAPPLSNLHFKGNKLDAKIDAAMSAAPAVDTTDTTKEKA